jgi:hypothetical protein
MKKGLMMGVLMGIIAIANAQDVIYFRNGVQQRGKVLQIGTNEVSYKKAENPDGPNYIVPKSDISMIEYPNGYKEIITPDNTASNQSANPVYSQPAPTYVQPQVSVIAPPAVVYVGGGYGYGWRGGFHHRGFHHGGWGRGHCRW